MPTKVRLERMQIDESIGAESLHERLGLRGVGNVLGGSRWRDGDWRCQGEIGALALLLWLWLLLLGRLLLLLWLVLSRLWLLLRYLIRDCRSRRWVCVRRCRCRWDVRWLKRASLHIGRRRRRASC